MNKQVDFIMLQGMAWCGKARSGAVWRGGARQGSAKRGKVRLGMAWFKLFGCLLMLNG